MQELDEGPISPNPIMAVTNPSWLYVPRGRIVVPVGGSPPPTDNFRITQAGDFRITQSGDFRITQQ